MLLLSDSNSDSVSQMHNRKIMQEKNAIGNKSGSVMQAVKLDNTQSDMEFIRLGRDRDYEQELRRLQVE